MNERLVVWYTINFRTMPVIQVDRKKPNDQRIWSDLCFGSNLNSNSGLISDASKRRSALYSKMIELVDYIKIKEERVLSGGREHYTCRFQPTTKSIADSAMFEMSAMSILKN
jgi:hypothetical protein